MQGDQDCARTTSHIAPAPGKRIVRRHLLPTAISISDRKPKTALLKNDPGQSDGAPMVDHMPGAGQPVSAVSALSPQAGLQALWALAAEERDRWALWLPVV